MRLGKALAALGMTVGIMVTATGTAHAAHWINTFKSGDHSEDPGGRWATSWLTHSEDGGSYWIHFDPHGEKLSLRDSYADGHAAKGRVIVNDTDGRRVDEDTFYVGTADGLTTYNLGSPDGSGDIPEGYSVMVYVCINETNTCSTGALGRA